MTKELAISLKKEAQRVADMYSNPNRLRNKHKETYTIDNVYAMSDSCATVVLKRSKGKKALLFFYYIKGLQPGWRYFIPTDSHILGFRAFEMLKLKAEMDNYKYNFDEHQK